MPGHAAHDSLHLAPPDPPSPSCPPDPPDHAQPDMAANRDSIPAWLTHTAGMLPEPATASARAGHWRQAWLHPYRATWPCLWGSLLIHGLTAALLLGLSFGSGGGGGEGGTAYLEVRLAGLSGGTTGGGNAENRMASGEAGETPGAATRATRVATPNGANAPVPTARNPAPAPPPATKPVVPAAGPPQQGRWPPEAAPSRRDAATSSPPLKARDARPNAGSVMRDDGPNAGPDVNRTTREATSRDYAPLAPDSTARTIAEPSTSSAISGPAGAPGTSGNHPVSGASAGTGSGAGGQAGAPGTAQPGTRAGGPAGTHGVGAPGGGGPFGYAVHDVDVRPAVRHRVTPEYPDQARRTGTQGRVVLRLLVDEHGHARHVSVLEAMPDGMFEQCALDAVARWSFTPGQRDGRPVPTWVHLPLRFDLAGR